MTEITGPRVSSPAEPDFAGAEAPATTVRPGEASLAHVAQRLQLATVHLAAANPHIPATSELKVGQEIRLPSQSRAAETPVETVIESPAPGHLSARGELNFRAGALKGALQHAGSMLEERLRPPDPSDRRMTPPGLGDGMPLDFDPAPGWQRAVMPQPPPPPPDDLSARDQLGLPARLGVDRDGEGPEDVDEFKPGPDTGVGGPQGPPTRSKPQPGIGLHHQPAAAPLRFIPGTPLLREDDIPDANALRLPREPAPRPNVGPGLDISAAETSYLDDPSRPPIPGPNAGVGGENSPPSPPPPPDGDVHQG